MKRIVDIVEGDDSYYNLPLDFHLLSTGKIWWQSMIVVIKINHCHWICNDSIEKKYMLKMVVIQSSTHNSSIEPDEGGNKQH